MLALDTASQVASMVREGTFRREAFENIAASLAKIRFLEHSAYHHAIESMIGDKEGLDDILGMDWTQLISDDGRKQLKTEVWDKISKLKPLHRVDPRFKRPIVKHDEL